MENKDKLRMYGFVPYSLSPIQQAIQFGHAVVEYQLEHDALTVGLSIYRDWAENYKTFIILNGGTTNNDVTSILHLDVHPLEKIGLSGIQYCIAKLDELNIDYATFQEPDLNDATTAVVFILSEEVYNYTKFPKIEDWAFENVGSSYKKDYLPHYSRYLTEIFGSVEKGEYIGNVRNFISKYRFA